MLHEDLWTWCRHGWSFCLYCKHFSFFYSGKPSLVQACSQAAFRYSCDISACPSSSSSFHLLGADVLSRPTNDLRKVLSRDPDHDFHHFFFSPIPTNDICSRTKAIAERKARGRNLEQSEEKRAKWIEEHAAETGRRDDGRRRFYLVGHFWIAQREDII